MEKGQKVTLRLTGEPGILMEYYTKDEIWRCKVPNGKDVFWAEKDLETSRGIDCLRIGLCNKVKFCKENICERAETVDGDVSNPRDALWERLVELGKEAAILEEKLSATLKQYHHSCVVCGKEVLPGFRACSQECMQDVYCNE